VTPRHPLARLFPPWGRDDLDIEGRERLANILGVPLNELDVIRLGPRYHYRPMTRAKPDGRERRVLAPSPALKTLQRRFLNGYLDAVRPHPAAKAFHRGGSTVAHVLPHSRSRLIAAVDLRDFFESTRGGRVARWLSAQGWGREAVRILTRLCVYRDGLPQGAPTSPSLSNLVNHRLDERLSLLTRRTGGVYTRYGDDLAFSWDEDRLPDGFKAAVEDALARSGYEIQPLKDWRMGATRDGFELVGLVLQGDGRVRVPRPLRWRATLLRWRAFLSRDPVTYARASGLNGYLKMVDRGRGM